MATVDADTLDGIIDNNDESTVSGDVGGVNSDDLILILDDIVPSGGASVFWNPGPNRSTVD